MSKRATASVYALTKGCRQPKMPVLLPMQASVQIRMIRQLVHVYRITRLGVNLFKRD